MTGTRTITITIGIDLDAVEADALEPVDGWSGRDDSQPPIPGALALGQWLAGSLAGDCLAHISTDLDPVISLIRVTLGDGPDDDDVL